MWKTIITKEDILRFMEEMECFHDSCIKEISYLSGAYVNDNLGMHPINDSRVLKIVIQRQYEKNSMIEMEFQGLKFLRLFPADENYTCEILDATMLLKDEKIYWCDCGNLSEAEIDNYNGTVICAAKVKWHSIENCMGKKEFYHSDI